MVAKQPNVPHTYANGCNEYLVVLLVGMQIKARVGACGQDFSVVPRPCPLSSFSSLPVCMQLREQG